MDSIEQQIYFVQEQLALFNTSRGTPQENVTDDSEEGIKSGSSEQDPDED